MRRGDVVDRAGIEPRPRRGALLIEVYGRRILLP